jgi:hypothetical protein
MGIERAKSAIAIVTALNFIVVPPALKREYSLPYFYSPFVRIPLATCYIMPKEPCPGDDVSAQPHNYVVKAVASSLMFGTPMPVTRSWPGPAEKAPLFPLVISRKLELPERGSKPKPLKRGGRGGD